LFIPGPAIRITLTIVAEGIIPSNIRLASPADMAGITISLGVLLSIRKRIL
jgi:hypothetical protein